MYMTNWSKHPKKRRTSNRQNQRSHTKKVRRPTTQPLIPLQLQNSNTASYQFQRIPVPGNGDCMFIALACGFGLEWDETFSPEGKELAKKLRKRIAKYMRKEWPDFGEWMWTVKDQGSFLDALHIKHNQNLPVDVFRSLYLDGVANNMYGDSVVRLAFQTLTQTEVVVYELDPTNPQVIVRQTGFLNESLPTKIFILNLNPHSGGSAHFELLRPMF